MEIIVCVKPVLDPDLPPVKFAVDLRATGSFLRGMPVMNPTMRWLWKRPAIKEAKKTARSPSLRGGQRRDG